MNIAIFTNNYLPNPYGVTVSVESFRKEFEKQGHNVYIFAPRVKEYEDTNLNVYRYSSVDIKYRFRYPLPIPYSQRVKEFLKETPLDIVHSQHPNLLGLAARRWAKKKNVPLIFTWHTLYDQYTHFAPPLIPQKLAMKAVIRNAIQYANKSDQVIVPTGSTHKIIRSWGVTNQNIAEIPTGIDEKKHASPDSERIRKKYKIQSDEKVLFTVSRLTKEKNVLFLMHSIMPILKKDHTIKYIVSGNGYLLEELRALTRAEQVERQVLFTGIVPHEEIKDYYAACDIFLWASKSETQGLVIAEAMYAGVPVVAVRASGAQDMIMDKVTGVLVDEDKEKFRDAVKQLVKNTEQRERFSQKAQEIARKTLTSSVCTKQLLKVYKETIARFG